MAKDTSIPQLDGERYDSQVPIIFISLLGPMWALPASACPYTVFGRKRMVNACPWSTSKGIRGPVGKQNEVPLKNRCMFLSVLRAGNV